MIPASRYALPVPWALSPQPEVLAAALGAMEGGNPQDRHLRLAFLDPALTAELFRLARLRSVPLDRMPWTLEGLAQQFGDALVSSVIVEAGERLAARFALDDAPPHTTGFWLHSLACAHIARSLAEAVGHDAPDEAYIVGLLHDVGMIAFAASDPDAYGSLRGSGASERDLLAAEASSLGAAHPALGASMADDWHLPAHLGDAMLLHHMDAGELRGAHVLARILAAAESFASGTTPSAVLDALARLLQLDVHLLVQAVNKGVQRAQASAAEVGLADAEVRRHFPEGFPQFAAPVLRAPIPPSTGSDEMREAPAGRRVMERLLERARIDGKVAEVARAKDAQGAMLKVLDVLQVGYGIESFIVFLPEGATESWAGWRVAPAGLEQLNFRVPFSVRTSLVVAAAKGRTPVSARDDLELKGLTGIDLQIARRLRGDDLLAIPAIDEGEICAVIVLSQANTREGPVSVPIGLATRLAAAVAQRMRGSRSSGRESRSIEKKVRETVKGEVRQLLHEARNPLTILGNYLELVGQRGPGESLQDEMAVMRHELERVTSILDRIGRLEGSPPPRNGEVDVNHVVTALLVAYQSTLFDSRQITLGLHLSPTLQPIDTDADAVRQVLLNLLKNASEAVPPGGRVIVTTAAKVVDGHAGVEIQIVDNGPGLPADVVKRLEQPPPRRESPERGFGLPNCINLIRSLKGRLSWGETTGGGATFRIFIPALASRDPRKASETP
jgi:signal transduction histidine kinase/HD-like signal output (HDOD) protein